eukprot:5733350-Lingulodinium_polyedra.AAC.1
MLVQSRRGRWWSPGMGIVAVQIPQATWTQMQSEGAPTWPCCERHMSTRETGVSKNGKRDP